MKAKQLLALFLALLTVMTMVVSCGGGKDTETQAPAGSDTDAPVVDTEPVDTEIKDDLGDANFANVTNPTVTFFARTGYEHEVWVEEITDAAMIEASYWRTQTVQNRLGVTIAQISQPGSWSTYQEWNSTLRNAIQTESHDFDATMFYAGCSSSLAIEGCYLNLLEQDMISLEKPWWNQNITKEATVYGSLFFTSGAIATSQLQQANVLFYNKDLYNEYFATAGKKDIYQVVRDGEWTIDYLHELTAAVWDDADSNGEVSSGDIVGWGGGSGNILCDYGNRLCRETVAWYNVPQGQLLQGGYLGGQEASKSTVEIPVAEKYFRCPSDSSCYGTDHAYGSDWLNVSYVLINFCAEIGKSRSWNPQDASGKKVYGEIIGRDNPGTLVGMDVTPAFITNATSAICHPNNVNTLYLGGHVKTQNAKFEDQKLLDSLRSSEKFNEFPMKKL